MRNLIIILVFLFVSTVIADSKPEVKFLYKAKLYTDKGFVLDNDLYFYCIDGYKYVLRGDNIEQMFERSGSITSLKPVKCK